MITEFIYILLDWAIIFVIGFVVGLLVMIINVDIGALLILAFCVLWGIMLVGILFGYVVRFILETIVSLFQ